VEYLGGSKLNVREDAKLPQPELARIGCIWLIGGQTVAVSNRHVHLVDPNQADAIRDSHASSGGSFGSVAELFRQRVDPATVWLEGNSGGLAQWMAVHDFERWCGNVGDGERYFDSHEMNRAIEGGQQSLVDGMLAAGTTYAASGRQVVFHSGCPDSANFAGDSIRQGRSAELLESLHATYHPLVKRRIGIGLDNAAAQPIQSISYTKALELRLMGAFVQVEATPELSMAHWHGWPARIVHDIFVQRHVTQANWAVGRFAKLGTKQFTDLHPDVRVSIFPSNVANPQRVDGDEAQRREFLADVAKLSKPIVAAGCRVLLHERIVLEAMKLGVSVEAFLP
jgi:hypothetical protein